MHKLKLLTISAVLASSLVGCTDYFEMERPPQIPINTLEDLEFAAVSPYNKVFYGGWGAFQSNDMLNQVLLSDYFKWIGNVEDYPTEDIFMRRVSQRVSQVEELYGKLYNAIGACNSGLYFYDSTNDRPLPYVSVEDQEINVMRIKGELLFIRAYSYYNLAKIFCPPYGYGRDSEAILVKRDHLVLSADDAINNTPSPTSEIYEMMISDLKMAVKYLPDNWEIGMHESYKSRGRANRWAAKALLAQVYFTMQRFDDAISLYDDIIENGGYTLEENPFTNFNNESVLPLREENKEVIMWMFYADSEFNKTRHNSLRLCQFNKNKVDAKNGGNGPGTSSRNPDWSFHDWLQICLEPSAVVKMGWMNPDGTETPEALADLRYYNQPSGAGKIVNKEGLFYRFEGFESNPTSSKRTGATSDGKYITYGKYASYIGSNDPVVILNKYFRTTNGHLQNQPFIRLAEIYLNRAAARLMTNKKGWSDDYNKVASRAWNAEAAGKPYEPKTDAQVDQETLRIERWKELAGEDSWYIQYCAALGLSVEQGSRNGSSSFNTVTPSNFANFYWENCIPLGGELDFR